MIFSFTEALVTKGTCFHQLLAALSLSSWRYTRTTADKTLTAPNLPVTASHRIEQRCCACSGRYASAPAVANRQMTGIACHSSRAVSSLGSVCHGSWNVTAKIGDRGSTELADAITEGPRGRPLQWRKRRPEPIEARASIFSSSRYPLIRDEKSANLGDRIGSMRSKSSARASGHKEVYGDSVVTERVSGCAHTMKHNDEF
jgi:hypothetical protein